MNRHRIPAEVFASLAEGNGGETAIRYLAAVDYSKRLLLVHGVVATAQDSAHPQHGLARRAYDLLASIQEQAPGAVDTVLRYPSVGAWSGRTLRALRGGPPQAGAEPAGLAVVAAAAAIRAGFPCAIEVRGTNGVVTLPSLGQAVIPGLAATDGVAVLRSTTAGAELVADRHSIQVPDNPHVNAHGWAGLRLISAHSRGTDIQLLIDDLDPYRMPAIAVSRRLTGREADRWKSLLQEAWEILMLHHRAVAAEIQAAIRVLVPRQAPEHGMVSATSRETFGCIGLSAPSDPLELAVTLAHEVQHAKLCALQDVIRLTYPDNGLRYYAPWREDPRPASGLLQGAYAYLGVAAFWRRQRHEEQGTVALGAHAEFARWRSAVLTVTMKLLDSGQLTTAGKHFVSRMERVARSWQGDPVPSPAAEMARDAARRHARHWSLRYGADRLGDDIPRLV